MMLGSSTLRELWTVVEGVPCNDLLTLSDTALIAMLIQQVSRRVFLSGNEIGTLYEYLGSKTLLIRDMAASRRARNLKPVAG